MIILHVETTYTVGSLTSVFYCVYGIILFTILIHHGSVCQVPLTISFLLWLFLCADKIEWNAALSALSDFVFSSFNTLNNCAIISLRRIYSLVFTEEDSEIATTPQSWKGVKKRWAISTQSTLTLSGLISSQFPFFVYITWEKFGEIWRKQSHWTLHECEWWLFHFNLCCVRP